MSVGISSSQPSLRKYNLRNCSNFDLTVTGAHHDKGLNILAAWASTSFFGNMIFLTELFVKLMVFKVG